MTEAFTSIDVFEVRGRRCFGVKLASTFRNREAMGAHYFGRTIIIDGATYLVKGVESFARGGEFGPNDTVGMWVEPGKECKL